MATKPLSVKPPHHKHCQALATSTRKTLSLILEVQVSADKWRVQACIRLKLRKRALQTCRVTHLLPEHYIAPPNLKTTCYVHSEQYRCGLGSRRAPEVPDLDFMRDPLAIEIQGPAWKGA